MLRTGAIYAIGRHVDGGFAVWDQTLSEPVARYTASEWPKATADLERAEAAGPERPGSPWWRRWLARIAVSALTVVVIVTYILVHLATYDRCLYPPSLFSWPSKLEAVCVPG